MLGQEAKEKQSANKTLEALQLLLRDLPRRDFTIQLWDGETWPAQENSSSQFTWKIHHPEALRAVLLSSDRQLALAEAYVSGDFDVLGDLERVLPLAEFLMTRSWSASEKLHLLTLLGVFTPRIRRDGYSPKLAGRLHSKQRDQMAVSYHYDLSNEFYSLWLDREMQYSCAYFENPEQDLETAQFRKLDYICRKLRLRKGDQLLDIGCGWGGLMIHAAREYGARVVGITLSDHQLKRCRSEIKVHGLAQQCEVRLQDYRDLEAAETFDKIVSVGMVEHVGKAFLPGYFRQAYRLLRTGGVFLNAGIGRPGRGREIEPKIAFTDRYIFPDGELVSIGTLLSCAEQQGFEVRDVENLREHYMLTVRHWLHRLDAAAEAARRIVGETKYRMWRLYLAGSAYYFRRGWLDLYHSLFIKPQENATHVLTRAN